MRTRTPARRRFAVLVSALAVGGVLATTGSLLDGGRFGHTWDTSTAAGPSRMGHTWDRVPGAAQLPTP